jgi:hypothetical protein
VTSRPKPACRNRIICTGALAAGARSKRAHTRVGPLGEYQRFSRVLALPLGVMGRVDRLTGASGVRSGCSAGLTDLSSGNDQPALGAGQRRPQAVAKPDPSALTTYPRAPTARQVADPGRAQRDPDRAGVHLGARTTDRKEGPGQEQEGEEGKPPGRRPTPCCGGHLRSRGCRAHRATGEAGALPPPSAAHFSPARRPGQPMAGPGS